MAEKKNAEAEKVRQKAIKVIKAVQPQLDFFDEYRGHYSSCAFIPEDLGFSEHIHKEDGLPDIRIYHRDGMAITKMKNGKWKIVWNDMTLSLTIQNKFEAYHFLRALGIKIN